MSNSLIAGLCAHGSFITGIASRMRKISSRYHVIMNNSFRMDYASRVLVPKRAGVQHLLEGDVQFTHRSAVTAVHWYSRTRLMLNDIEADED